MVESLYREVVVETYRAVGEPSSSGVRVRPLPGQGYSVHMNVECSKSMRQNHPVGTRFLIQATLTSKEGGSPFLYSYFQWPYRVLSAAEVDEHFQRKAR